MTYRLTMLQFAASRHIINCYNRKQDGCIIAVCGAGKTEMCFPIIEKTKFQINIAFSIPRIDICHEIYQRLKENFPPEEIGLRTGYIQENVNAKILVLTTNQLLKYRTYFQLIIIDEVDAFPFDEDPKYYGGVQKCIDQGTIIYLTSTPSIKLKQKSLPTFLIYKRWHNYPLPVPKLFQGNYQSEFFNFKLYWIIKKRNRQLLIFIATIKDGEIFSKRLRKLGINHNFVYSTCLNRKQLIDDFRQRKFEILLTTTILERGVTFEDIDVLVVDSDNRFYSKANLVQIAGRARRKINRQRGNVYFCYQEYTSSIANAIQQIKDCNKKM